MQLSPCTLQPPVMLTIVHLPPMCWSILLQSLPCQFVLEWLAVPCQRAA